MRKILVFIVVLLMLSTAAGCQHVREYIENAPVAAVTAAPTEQAAPAAQEQPKDDVPAPVQPQTDETQPVRYAFTFTAKTMEGETVTEEYFGQYDLTMVNVWASWCGPCLSELGELGELCGRLPQNVGFLSVTVDTPDALQDAKARLQENGCTFPCVDGQGSEGLLNGFLYDVMAIPTTVFFDRSGNQVGEWIVGVPQSSGSVADVYLSEIQARLGQMNGK